jgi:predicted transcriptional regulator
MKTLVVKVESMNEFLAWSNELAAKIARGRKLPETCVISYQDPEELATTFTQARRDLLDSITQQAGTLENIAARVERGPAEVAQDIDCLVDAGALRMDGEVVSAIAEQVVFEAHPRPAALCGH